MSDVDMDDGAPSGYFSADVWRQILKHADLQTAGRLCSTSKYMWLTLSLEGFAAGVLEFPSKSPQGVETSSLSTSANSQTAVGFAALSASTFLLRSSWKRAARERMEQSTILAERMEDVSKSLLDDSKNAESNLRFWEAMVDGRVPAFIQAHYERGGHSSGSSNAENQSKAIFEKLDHAEQRLGHVLTDAVPSLLSVSVPSLVSRLFLTMRFGPLETSRTVEDRYATSSTEVPRFSCVISTLPGISALQRKLHDSVHSKGQEKAARPSYYGSSSAQDKSTEPIDPTLVDKLYCDCSHFILDDDGETLNSSVSKPDTSVSEGKQEEDRADADMEEASVGEGDDPMSGDTNDDNDADLLRDALRPSAQNSPEENGLLHILHAFRDCCELELVTSVRILWTYLENAVGARPRRLVNLSPHHFTDGLANLKEQPWWLDTHRAAAKVVGSALLVLLRTVLVEIPTCPVKQFDSRLFENVSSVGEVLNGHKKGPALLSSIFSTVADEVTELLFHPLLVPSKKQRLLWAQNFSQILADSPLVGRDSLAPFCIDILGALQSGWDSLLPSYGGASVSECEIRARNEPASLLARRWHHVRNEVLLWDMVPHLSQKVAATEFAGVSGREVWRLSAAALWADVAVVLEGILPFLETPLPEALPDYALAPAPECATTATAVRAAATPAQNCWRPLAFTEWFDDDKMLTGLGARMSSAHFMKYVGSSTSLHPLQPSSKSSSYREGAMKHPGGSRMDSIKGTLDPAYWRHSDLGVDDKSASTPLTTLQKKLLSDSYGAMSETKGSHARSNDIRDIQVRLSNVSEKHEFVDYHAELEKSLAVMDLDFVNLPLDTLLRVLLLGTGDGLGRFVHFERSKQPSHRDNVNRSVSSGCNVCRRIAVRYGLDEPMDTLLKDAKAQDLCDLMVNPSKADVDRKAKELRASRQPAKRNRELCRSCGTYHDYGYSSDDYDSEGADLHPEAHDYRDARTALSKKKWLRFEGVEAPRRRPFISDVLLDDPPAAAFYPDERAGRLLALFLWFMDFSLLPVSCPTREVRAVHLSRVIFEFLAVGPLNKDKACAWLENPLSKRAVSLFLNDEGFKPFIEDLGLGLFSAAGDSDSWRSWFADWIRAYTRAANDGDIVPVLIYCASLYCALVLATDAPVHLLRVCIYLGEEDSRIACELLAPLASRALASPLNSGAHNLPKSLEVAVSDLRARREASDYDLQITGVTAWARWSSMTESALSEPIGVPQMWTSLTNLVLSQKKSDAGHKAEIARLKKSSEIADRSLQSLKSRFEGESTHFSRPRVLLCAALLSSVASGPFPNTSGTVLEDSSVLVAEERISKWLLGGDTGALLQVAQICTDDFASTLFGVEMVAAGHANSGRFGYSDSSGAKKSWADFSTSVIRPRFGNRVRDVSSVTRSSQQLRLDQTALLSMARDCVSYVKHHKNDRNYSYSRYQRYSSYSQTGNFIYSSDDKKKAHPGGGAWGPTWAAWMVSQSGSTLAPDKIPSLVRVVAPKLLHRAFLDKSKWRSTSPFLFRRRPTYQTDKSDSYDIGNLYESAPLVNSGCVSSVEAIISATRVDYATFISSGALPQSISSSCLLHILESEDHFSNASACAALLCSSNAFSDCGFDPSVVAWCEWLKRGSEVLRAKKKNDPRGLAFQKTKNLYMCVVDGPFAKHSHEHSCAATCKEAHSHEDFCVFDCKEARLADVDADAFARCKEDVSQMTVGHLYCYAAAACCNMSVSRLLDTADQSIRSNNNLPIIQFRDMCISVNGRWIPPPVGSLHAHDGIRNANRGKFCVDQVTLGKFGISAGDVVCVGVRAAAYSVFKIWRSRMLELPVDKVSDLSADMRRKLTPTSSNKVSAAAIKDALRRGPGLSGLGTLIKGKFVRLRVSNNSYPNKSCTAKRLQNGWAELASFRNLCTKVQGHEFRPSDNLQYWATVLREWSPCGMACSDCEHCVEALLRGETEIRLGPDRTYEQMDHLFLALNCGHEVASGWRNKITTPKGQGLLDDLIFVRMEGSGKNKTVIVTLPSPTPIRVSGSGGDLPVDQFLAFCADLKTREGTWKDLHFTDDLDAVSDASQEILASAAATKTPDLNTATISQGAEATNIAPASKKIRAVASATKRKATPKANIAAGRAARSKSMPTSAKADSAMTTNEPVDSDSRSSTRKRGKPDTPRRSRSTGSALSTATQSDPAGNGEADKTGEALIGVRVRVFWETENQHFEGVVKSYHPTLSQEEGGEYKVLYDDGDVEMEVYESLEFIKSEGESKPRAKKRQRIRKK